MYEPPAVLPGLEFRLEKNAGLITRLNRHVHTPHQERHPDIFAPYDYNSFYGWYEAVLAREGTYAPVAYLEGEPVGYALLFHKKNTGGNPFLQAGYEYIHLDQMGVAAEYRNRGIGRSLVQYICAFCREKGVARLQLSVWLGNEAARRFYRESGFESYMEYMELKIG